MADSREVMNIRQASQYLGVSPDTLYKYVGEQRIPAFKLGNRWRFKKTKLDQWMEEKSSEVEPGPKSKTKAAGAQEEAQCRGQVPEGSQRNLETAGGTPVLKPRSRQDRRYKRRAHVWNGIENNGRPRCGLLQHQGGGAEEDACRD